MKTATRGIAVTGQGIVSPLGLTLDALWDALSQGECGIAPFSSPSPGAGQMPIDFAAPAKFSGHVDDYGQLHPDQKKIIRKGIKLMSREIQMGVAAAQRALQDAEIVYESLEPSRVGVILGSDYIISPPEECFDAIAACSEEDGSFEYPKWGAGGYQKMTPLWQLKYLPNMPASHIAIYNNFHGPNNSITLREASIGAVISESINIISRGRADVILVGATGSRIHPNKLIAALQQEDINRHPVDSKSAMRPFDRDRIGTILGEGAGALVLEDMEFAKARGAKVHAEIIAASCAATIGSGMTANRALALANVIDNVLKAAESAFGPEFGLDSIGHINAHGLGTRDCDIEEAKAISEIFGNRANPIPVTAAKSYFGNLGAGAGAIELIAGILSLNKNAMFPTLNFENADPECPINPVREFGGAPGNSFIKLALNRQGQASAILVRKV